jgi:predicted Zn finger-like uncharacterized protein
MGLKPLLVPMASIDDRINAAGRTLPLCVFHPRCREGGLSALEQYRREWDDEKKAFRASARCTFRGASIAEPPLASHSAADSKPICTWHRPRALQSAPLPGPARARGQSSGRVLTISGTWPCHAWDPDRHGLCEGRTGAANGGVQMKRSPDFSCPNCGTEYKIVEVEVPAGPREREVTCLECGAPFVGRRGNLIIKYICVSAKNRRGYGPAWRKPGYGDVMALRKNAALQWCHKHRLTRGGPPWAFPHIGGPGFFTIAGGAFFFAPAPIKRAW